MPQELEGAPGSINQLEVLNTRLRFGLPLDREAAAHLLASEGAYAIPLLLETLKHDPERFVRLAAATSLCRIAGDAGDVQRLPAEVADQDLEFMLDVVRARWRHGTAFPFLLHRIESSDPREVCLAVRAVVRLLAHLKPHSSEALELGRCVSKALASRHREVRLETVRAMSRVGHPDGLVALTPYLSKLAKRSHRAHVIVGLAIVLGAVVLGNISQDLSLHGYHFIPGVELVLGGGVLALLVGLARVFIQVVSGSRFELEQVLSACASQDPGRVASLRDQLQRIASPVAGQSSESQRHARELLRQVRTHELLRGSLPIAASLPESAVEELPTPAAAPDSQTDAAPPVKVC